MSSTQQYDAVILGAGLAALTLAKQLKIGKPDIKLLLLERRSGAAPIATHKVGESLSELGSSYLREVLGLKEYLNKAQLRKLGFRFFLNPEQREDIAERVEVGARHLHPFPSHQLDRGILENDLSAELLASGVEICYEAKVCELTLDKNLKTVSYEKGTSIQEVCATWLIDASGRAGILKEKLSLEQDIAHNINSAWFRLDASIDVDNWSDRPDWLSRVEPGRRRLATNHLMGKGYWVWIIPLVGDRTSIGIVADPRFHPFHEFNSFEKAMQWFQKQEPLAARIIEMYRDKLMDFKLMKNFAYDCRQFYSDERWGIVGEAGAFLDPFYSPGSDLIALGNSWLSDLILRDLQGEDIRLRALIYEHAHHELLSGWILLYRDMYEVFDNATVMMSKIVWDWATYWALLSVMFMNGAYTDLELLKFYAASDTRIGQGFAQLNAQMQELFRFWAARCPSTQKAAYLNVFDLDVLQQLQAGLSERLDKKTLRKTIQNNYTLLEKTYAEIFRRAANALYQTPKDMPVAIYTARIDAGKDALLAQSKLPEAMPVDAAIATDMNKLSELKNKAPFYESAR